MALSRQKLLTRMTRHSTEISGKHAHKKLSLHIIYQLSIYQIIYQLSLQTHTQDKTSIQIIKASEHNGTI